MKVRETFAGLALSALLLGACGQSDVVDTQEGISDSSAPGIDEETANADDSDDAEDENTNDSEGDVDGEESNPEDFESLPFGGGVIGGNIGLSYPDGEPGEISVVAEFPENNGGYITAIFRNNTGESIAKVEFDVTASADGEQLETGRSQNIIPAVIEPGGLGVAYINIVLAHNLPEDVDYDYEVEWEVEGDERFSDLQDFNVTEAKLVDESIVGSAVNESDVEIDGPVDVEILCFEGSDIAAMFTGRTLESGLIAPGDTVTFQTRIVVHPCTDYAVSVIGETD